MEYRNLNDAVGEKLDNIAEIIASVEKGTSAANLCLLMNHLIDALDLFRRNPGIEAAADDLYQATTAVACELRGNLKPSSRRMRLLREAHLRFRSRLEAAVERLGPYEHLMVPLLQARQAA